MTIRYLIITLFLLELCSLSESRQAQRILNGTEVTSIMDFPFVATVRGFHINKRRVSQTCTASIINEDTILTATHCICKQKFNQSRIYVRVGISDLKHRRNIYKAKISIAADPTYCHSSKYDIAVLKLKKNLTFSDKVQPIKIDYNEPDFGTRVVMLGYGKHNLTERSKGKLQFAPNILTECHGDPYFVDMLCTDPNLEANARISFGDSGGPLVHYKNGKYYQIGVNSGGSTNEVKEGYPRCILVNGTCYISYSGYVSTAFNKDFLQKNI